MALTDEQIITLLKARIHKKQMKGAIAYLDACSKASGERISIGQKEYRMPFNGYFIFIDLIPVANWGHPALCVFISQKGDRVSVMNTDFPPFFGNPPATFRKLIF